MAFIPDNTSFTPDAPEPKRASSFIPDVVSPAVETIKRIFGGGAKTVIGQPEAVSDTATQVNKAIKPFYQPIPKIKEYKEGLKKNLGNGVVGEVVTSFIPDTPVDVGLATFATNLPSKAVDAASKLKKPVLDLFKRSPKPFARPIGDILSEKGINLGEPQIKAIVAKAGGKNARISDYGEGNKMVEFEGIGDTTLTHKIEDVNTVEKVQALLKEKENMFKAAKGQMKLKSYPQTIKKSKFTPPELAEKLGGEYTVKPNADMLARAQSAVKSNPEEALNRVLSEKATDENITLAGELIKHHNAKNNFEISQQIIDTLDPQLREAGRTIQAVSLYNNITPEGIVGFAQRRLSKVAEKFPNWAPKLKIDETKANELRSLAEAAQKLPDGEEKLIALNNLNQKINSYIPSSIADKAIALWKAGLLTGLKTTGGNLLSNTVNAGMETVSKAAAVPYDVAMSWLSGKRTATFSGEGYFKGFKEGLDKGATFLRTGFDPRRGNPMLKYDQLQVNFDTPILKKYVDASFRNMGAQDQPFYYGALKASIIEQTKVQGMNKGLSGKNLDAFVRKTLESGKIPEEILKNAANDAQIAVYTNDTQLGKIGQAIQKTGPLGQAVIPFAKTPAAVATQVINYTPVGAIKPIIQGIQSAITRGTFNQRELAQALGRVTTGAPILYLGKKLYESGRITLSMPKSEREREQMEREGKKPNSIRMGDKYYNLAYFGPFGVLMLVGAYFQKGLQETGSKSMALAQSIAGVGKSTVDQTFLQGLSGVLDAVNDPSRFGEYMLSSTAGSVVPTIVGDTAKAIDPYQRVARDKQNLPKSIGMNIQSKIPILREKLPVRYDIFGKDIERGTTPLETMVDVTRATSVRNKDDKTTQELSILAKNPDTISTPTEIKPKQTVAGKDIEIPTKALYDINKHVGMEVKKTFDDFNQNPQYLKFYENLSPEQKSLIYNNISANIKSVNVIKYAMATNSLTKKEGMYALYKLAGGDKAKLVNFLSGKYFVPLDMLKLISQGRLIKKELTGKDK